MSVTAGRKERNKDDRAEMAGGVILVWNRAHAMEVLPSLVRCTEELTSNQILAVWLLLQIFATLRPR
jgi:hypothetical protein